MDLTKYLENQNFWWNSAFFNVNCWWSISHLQLWLFLWRNGFKWSGVSVSKNEQILLWWCCMFLLSSLQSPVCVYWAATQLNHWWGVFLKVEWPLVLLMDRPEVGKLMLATKATHKRSDWLIFCSFPDPQTMGGAFVGKEQDAAKGVYALVGMLLTWLGVVAF